MACHLPCLHPSAHIGSSFPSGQREWLAMACHSPCPRLRSHIESYFSSRLNAYLDIGRIGNNEKMFSQNEWKLSSNDRQLVTFVGPSKPTCGRHKQSAMFWATCGKEQTLSQNVWTTKNRPEDQRPRHAVLTAPGTHYFAPVAQYG